MSITIPAKKKIVRDFLKKCNGYAACKLQGYKTLLSEEKEPERRGELEEKTREWLSYQRFNEIALSELETATLDSWFK